MSFRKNIFFNEIKLYSYHSDDFDKLSKTATCYIRQDSTEMIQKSYFTCITFDALGANITELFNAVVENTPLKPKLLIDFIPNNDSDVSVITNMKIREVFSALESEFELSGIKVDQEQDYDCLIKELKDVVKKHRDGEHALMNTKTYDYIFGTLKTLSGPVGDKIKKYRYECQSCIGEFLSDSKIDDIVKYRNSITHGNYIPLNNDLADTTYILMEMVYCAMLKRISVSDNTIKDLFHNRILT